MKSKKNRWKRFTSMFVNREDILEKEIKLIDKNDTDYSKKEPFVSKLPPLPQYSELVYRQPAIENIKEQNYS